MKYDLCPEENPSIYLLTKGSFAFFLAQNLQKASSSLIIEKGQKLTSLLATNLASKKPPKKLFKVPETTIAKQIGVLLIAFYHSLTFQACSSMLPCSQLNSVAFFTDDCIHSKPSATGERTSEAIWNLFVRGHRDTRLLCADAICQHDSCR